MNNVGFRRTENQIRVDFEECCSLLAEGKTWAEIHYIINQLRDYSISARALSASYSRLLKQVAVNRSPEIEKERLIEDCEAIMMKAIIQFNKSLEDMVHTSVKSVESIKDGCKSEEVIRIMKSNGASEYLTIYMNAMDRKIKLLDLDKSTTFDINLFLKGAKLDDNTGDQATPITSERQALEYGKTIGRK
jgi:hypothetical protein